MTAWALITLAVATVGPDTDHWLTGASMPALPVTTLAGETTSPPWKGAETVVVLWAGWCGPCVEELPVLADAMNTVGDTARPVTLLSIDEQPKVARKALHRAVRKPPPWTSVWGGPEAGGRLGVRTVPAAFVVKAEGTIQSAWTGYQGKAAWTAILTADAP